MALSVLGQRDWCGCIGCHTAGGAKAMLWNRGSSGPCWGGELQGVALEFESPKSTTAILGLVWRKMISWPFSSSQKFQASYPWEGE